MSRENILSTPQERSNALLKNVYLWMTAGLLLTTVVAYVIGSNQQFLSRLYSTGAIYILMIAQLVIVPILTVDFEVVDELQKTERGEGGFGSTGR